MAYGMKRWTPTAVNEADDPCAAFCQYIQQTLGVPAPTHADRGQLRKRTNEFFEQYPHTDWHTLCRVVTWMVANKRRVPRVSQVMDFVKFAWAKGQLSELDPANIEDAEADMMINTALQIEEDPDWRKRLLLARSPQTKREVYALWLSEVAMAS